MSEDQRPAGQRKARIPLFSGEPFERMVAILIAMVTIIAALAAFLEASASARSDEALRDAQQYALQATGVKSRGEVQAGYAWADAYRLWLEMDTLGYRAGERGEAELAERYEAVRDRLADVSLLLAPPYFDPRAGGLPDINAYEADLYLIESTALGEHFANSTSVSDAWNSKAGAYVTILTLLTVTLFLYGLSTTIVGRMRWLFVGMGTLIANLTLIWMVVVVLAPVPSLPDSAIEAYAQGVGLAYRDEPEAAVQSFSQSLAQAPDYANAYYGRAKAYFALGAFAQAADDYQAGIDAGRGDVYAPWNLGWTYYRLGHFDQAIDWTRSALELAPDQIALHFNLGLAHLASGDVKSARAAYSTGSSLAAQQVAKAQAAGEEPPSALWWYLGASAIDLDNLLDCLGEGACAESPPHESITSPETVGANAEDLRREIKELAAALELTGQPGRGQVSASLSGLDVVEAVYDETGALAAYQPLDTQIPRLRGAAVFEDKGEAAEIALTRRDAGDVQDLYLAFDYEGLQDGQVVVVKVYVDGREATGLRLVDAWSLGPSGEAVLPLTPGGAYTIGPGRYRVEVYVDSILVAERGFLLE